MWALLLFCRRDKNYQLAVTYLGRGGAHIGVKEMSHWSFDTGTWQYNPLNVKHKYFLWKQHICKNNILLNFSCLSHYLVISAQTALANFPDEMQWCQLNSIIMFSAIYSRQHFKSKFLHNCSPTTAITRSRHSMKFFSYIHLGQGLEQKAYPSILTNSVDTFINHLPI